MSLTRKVLNTAGAVMIASAISLTDISAAQAVSKYRCVYPAVCIYNKPTPARSAGSEIIYRYYDVTDGWQRLPWPVSNFSVVNTRNDDAVYLAGHEWIQCLSPNDVKNGAGQALWAIRIVDTSQC
ncbi:hypothetical protein [Streptomyces toxytricini]|uniref:hypothetical protein n=1 Tax=Streptomyces toxytricini TaxID=67369 RepID=UPI003435E1EB